MDKKFVFVLRWERSLRYTNKTRIVYYILMMKCHEIDRATIVHLHRQKQPQFIFLARSTMYARVVYCVMVTIIIIWIVCTMEYAPNVLDTRLPTPMDNNIFSDDPVTVSRSPGIGNALEDPALQTSRSLSKACEKQLNTSRHWLKNISQKSSTNPQKDRRGIANFVLTKSCPRENCGTMAVEDRHGIGPHGYIKDPGMVKCNQSSFCLKARNEI